MINSFKKHLQFIKIKYQCEVECKNIFLNEERKNKMSTQFYLLSENKYFIINK